MRDYTVLRLDVTVGPVARVLRKVPGVTVGEDHAESADEEGPEGTPIQYESSRASTGETPPPSEPDGSVTLDVDDEADGGLADRLPPVVREWGLLVVGVLFLLVGVASAVLWAIRRRKEDGDEATDDEWSTVDSFDEPVDEWRPDDESPRRRGAEGGTDAADERQPITDSDGETSETAEATVLGAESQEDEPTAEVDTGALSATVDRTEPETTAEEAPVPEDDAESESSTEHEAESIDVAPLLGMGFLAVAAAVVKWAQRESADEASVR